MLSINNIASELDFGFLIELVQTQDNGSKVYAGYGFRVIEMDMEKGQTLYQLQIKDNLLLDWGLMGTFRDPSEIKRRVSQLDLMSEENSMTL